MLIALAGFAIAFALIFARVPIAIALGFVGYAGFAALNGMGPALGMVALSTSTSTMSYHLAVIPLFVLMGNLVAGAGISTDLYRAAQAFIGHRRAGDWRSRRLPRAADSPLSAAPALRPS